MNINEILLKLLPEALKYYNSTPEDFYMFFRKKSEKHNTFDILTKEEVLSIFNHIKNQSNFLSLQPIQQIEILKDAFKNAIL